MNSGLLDNREQLLDRPPEILPAEVLAAKLPQCAASAMIGWLTATGGIQHDERRDRKPVVSVSPDVVFSDRYSSDAGTACASAIPADTGAICDDPAEEGPRVEVSLDSGIMTPAQARRLPRHLHTADWRAEEWARDAAMARHPERRELRL